MDTSLSLFDSPLAHEERLALVMQATNDGLWDWNVLTGELFYSPRWKQMLGYETHELADHFESWQSRIHPDDQQWVLSAVEAHLQGQTSLLELEHRLRHRDGFYLHVLVRGISVRDEQGRVLRVAGSHTDLTARKEAEAALRRRDAILEAVRFAAEHFLDSTALWQEGIQVVLARLGDATGADRVHIFRNHLADDGTLLTSQRYEWVAAGIEPLLPNPQLQGLALSQMGLQRWERLLGQGSLVQGHVRHFPAEERRSLSAQGIRSLVAVPIFVGGEWWGFIGFDACSLERHWSVNEADALKAAASTLGAAIQRKRAEDELREAYGLLEQRVEERTQELSTLLTISHDVASTLELEPLLELILDRLRAVVEYRGALLVVQEGQELVVLGAYDEETFQDEALRGQRLRVEQALGYQEVVRLRGPVIVEDLLGTEPLAQAMLPTNLEIEQESFPFRSWMGIPLIHKEQVIGMLRLDHAEVGHFKEQHARLALAIANQAAVALENARLYQAEQERRSVAEGMREILTMLNSNLPLDETLKILVRQACHMLGADAAALYMPDEDGLLWVQAHSNLLPALIEIPIPSGIVSVGVAFAERQLITVSDTQRAPLPVNELERLELGRWQQVRSLVAGAYGALLAVPLIAKERPCGVLTLFHQQPRDFSGDACELALTFGDQAALAIENAQLREQVEQAAASAERSRLARELHDSVSQAFYGIALGARTARKLLDLDAGRVAEPLDYVLSLAEAGLAEMRALIFELRPESLATEGIVAALARQVASMRARHQLDVQADLGEEPDTTLDIKEALYRIAREGMHNIVKHARAQRVRVRLYQEGATLFLELTDDGVGFDPDGDFPGHLGLTSMRERAARLNGQLRLESRAGAGTALHVALPLPPATPVSGPRR